MKKFFIIVLALGFTTPVFCAYRKQKNWGFQKPPIGTPLNNSPLAKGLVSCWLFNDNGGNKYTDSGIFENIINSIVGTLSWKPSPYGSSLNSGSQGNYFTFKTYVTVNIDSRNGAPPSNSVPWTLAAIIYPTSVSSGTIIQYGEVNNSNWNYNMSLNGTNNLSCQSSGGTAIVTASALVVSANKWSFVAVSQSAAASRIFMVNNSFSSNSASMGGNTVNGLGVIGMMFVNSVAQTTAGWKGQIAAVYSWNRALTKTELLQWQADPFQMFSIPRFYLIHPPPATAKTYLFPDFGNGANIPSNATGTMIQTFSQ